MNFPDAFHYTKDHEWVRLDEDGLATVGITDYAQGELGDIVFVDIEPEGTEVKAEEVMGSVEAVKTVSDLFAPISGIIKTANEELEETPENVNNDPYGDGWMVKLRPENPGSVEELLSASEYRRLVGEDE